MPDRFIIQIYSRTMLDPLMELYPFKHVLYTIYQTSDNNQQVIGFCAASGVNVVAMHSSRCSDEFVSVLSALGVKSLVHTINDPKMSEELYRDNYSGVYTDYLTP